MEQKPKQLRKTFNQVVPHAAGSTPIITGLDVSNSAHADQMRINREEAAKPLRVPLHIWNGEPLEGNAKKMAMQALMDHGMRMFQLRPRGFRQLKDGSVPFLQRLGILSGSMTVEDTKPERSKRSMDKRAAYGRHLLGMRENPHQHESNRQRMLRHAAA